MTILHNMKQWFQFFFLLAFSVKMNQFVLFPWKIEKFMRKMGFVESEVETQKSRDLLNFWHKCDIFKQS